MRRIALLLYFGLLLLSPALSQDLQQRRLALLEIEGSGVSEDFLDLIKKALEEALFDVPGFEVIEREQLDLVLSEQELQVSGVINEETAVEIGKLLAADSVVTISVTQLVETLLTVKFVDVATAGVLYIETVPLKRQSDIAAATRRLASGAERVLFPSRGHGAGID